MNQYSPIMIEVDVSADQLEFEVEVETKIEVVSGDTYKGDYRSVPQFYEQTYATRNKLMKEDFVVEEIPQSEVSNPSGGLTLTIGG